MCDVRLPISSGNTTHAKLRYINFVIFSIGSLRTTYTQIHSHEMWISSNANAWNKTAFVGIKQRLWSGSADRFNGAAVNATFTSANTILDYRTLYWVCLCMTSSEQLYIGKPNQRPDDNKMNWTSPKTIMMIQSKVSSDDNTYIEYRINQLISISCTQMAREPSATGNYHIYYALHDTRYNIVWGLNVDSQPGWNVHQIQICKRESYDAF